MKRAAALVAVAIGLLALCAVYLGFGDTPPPWLIVATNGAILAVSTLALVLAWGQS